MSQLEDSFLGECLEDRTDLACIPRTSSHNRACLVSAFAADAAYATRRRLFVPSWWLVGYVVPHCPEILNVCGENGSFEILKGTEIPPKHFPLLCGVWMEILTVALSAEHGQDRHVEVPLQRWLRGTVSDLTAQAAFLEGYWGSPFQVLRYSRGKMSRSRSRSRGTVNLVCRCYVEMRSDNAPWLVMDLVDSLSQLCRQLPHLGLSPLVSVSPDVLRSLGTGKTLRKLASYLVIELMKQAPQARLSQDGWVGGSLELMSSASFHTELLRRTQTLYDHGIFGWDNLPPRARIRELKSQFSGGEAGGSPVVHCWKMSHHVQHACELEQILGKRLAGVDCGAVLNAKPLSVKTTVASVLPDAVLPEDVVVKTTIPPPLSSAPPPLAVTPTEPRLHLVSEQVNIADRVSRCGGTLITTPRITVRKSADPIPPVQQPKQPKAPVMDPSLEFAIQLSAFYESLTESQKVLFERKRSRLSPEQFRQYMLPELRARSLDLTLDN